MTASETPPFVFRSTSLTMRARFTPARSCSTFTRIRASLRLVRFSAAVSSPRGGFFFLHWQTCLNGHFFDLAEVALGVAAEASVLAAGFAAPVQIRAQPSPILDVPRR